MKKGQSLFEVVIALAISALIIGAVVSLVTNSIRNSTFSKNNSLASTYAQQATEWLRGQRDADVAAFSDKATASPTWCLPDAVLPADMTSIKTAPCASDDKISGTPFTRQVMFTPTQSLSSGTGLVVNLIEADITVSWSDSQGDHKVTSATSFSDWRQR